MSALLTRQQRRAMQRLADEVDRAIESDRRFFSRHAGRTYRLRLLSAAERQQVEIMRGAPLRLAPDQVAFVVMKQLVPGVRMKATVLGPRESVGEDLTDAEAGSVYEGYADQNPAIRNREIAMLKAVTRARSAPPKTGEAGA